MKLIHSLACIFVALACSHDSMSATSAWLTLASYEFDTDVVGSGPKGFEFSKSQSGKPGSWQIQAMDDAPSAKNVLVQADDDRSQDRFLMAIAKRAAVRDVRLTAKCKPLRGRDDQACGLVFRYQDSSNYYLARSNALEGNVRLHHVRTGRRSQLATWDGPVAQAAWHELAIEAVGEQIRVLLNGHEVIAHSDTTFVREGRLGLWTKADSVTAFDDFTIEVPAASP